MLRFKHPSTLSASYNMNCLDKYKTSLLASFSDDTYDSLLLLHLYNLRLLLFYLSISIYMMLYETKKSSSRCKYIILEKSTLQKDVLASEMILGHIGLIYWFIFF